METSYLQAHPFGNRNPRVDTQSLLRLLPGFESFALGDPKASKAQAVLLYHGDWVIQLSQLHNPCL